MNSYKHIRLLINTYNKHVRSITSINKCVLTDEMYALFQEQAMFKKRYKNGEYKSLTLSMRR